MPNNWKCCVFFCCVERLIVSHSKHSNGLIKEVTAHKWTVINLTTTTTFKSFASFWCVRWNVGLRVISTHIQFELLLTFTQFQWAHATYFYLLMFCECMRRVFFFSSALCWVWCFVVVDAVCSVCVVKLVLERYFHRQQKHQTLWTSIQVTRLKSFGPKIEMYTHLCAARGEADERQYDVMVQPSRDKPTTTTKKVLSYITFSFSLSVYLRLSFGSNLFLMFVCIKLNDWNQMRSLNWFLTSSSFVFMRSHWAFQECFTSWMVSYVEKFGFFFNAFYHIFVVVVVAWLETMVSSSN